MTLVEVFNWSAQAGSIKTLNFVSHFFRHLQGNIGHRTYLWSSIKPQQWRAPLNRHSYDPNPAMKVVTDPIPAMKGATHLSNDGSTHPIQWQPLAATISMLGRGIVCAGYSDNWTLHWPHQYNNITLITKLAKLTLFMKFNKKVLKKMLSGFYDDCSTQLVRRNRSV